MKKSYAYLDAVDDYIQDSNVSSLDFLSSSFSSPLLTGFPNLVSFRAAKTPLSNFKFSHLPSLRVVDLTLTTQLRTLIIKDCPNLLALDLSYSRVIQIQGHFPSLEYLSLTNTRLNTLPPAPKLKYLDISFSRLQINVKDYPELETFICNSNENIFISKISENTNIRFFETHYSTLTFDSVNPNSKLEYLSSNKIVYKQELPINITFSYKRLSIHGDIPIPSQSFLHLNAEILLYGPWGIPPQSISSAKFFPMQIPKPLFDEQVAADSILGALFGSAAMDMMSIGTESLSGDYSKMIVAGNPTITWNHPRINDHTIKFIRGTFNNTYHAVLVAQSLIHSNSNSSQLTVDIHDFMCRLYNWVQHGHQEHKTRGSLSLDVAVVKALFYQTFIDYPNSSVENVPNIPSNGCIVRIIPIGCFCFWNEEFVIQAAYDFSTPTHTDSRCIFSSIALSLIVSRLIQDKLGLKVFDLEETISEAKSKVPQVTEFQDDIEYYSNVQSIQELKLDEPNNSGYCLKPYGCAVWAIRSKISFTEALSAVVREGGDSSTNGAAIGVVLGVICGFNQLPSEILKYMLHGHWLFNEYIGLLQLMNVPNPFGENDRFVPSFWKENE
jgi:ADP-ribosylglycohydrolase